MTEGITLDLGGVNAYLLRGTKGFVLVDTGGPMVPDKIYHTRGDILFQQLEHGGVLPGNLGLVLLTHGDCDHAANAAAVAKKYRTPIAMHRDDLALVQAPTGRMILDGMRYRQWGTRMAFRLLQRPIGKAAQRIAEQFETFTPDFFVSEGETLEDYGIEGTILHLPGHTPGSIGVLLAGGELLAGDIFANFRSPVRALNALDFEELDKSIQRIKHMGISKVKPGHGKAFSLSEITL